MKLVHVLSRWLRNLDLRGARRLSVSLPNWVLPIPSGTILWPTLYGFSLKIKPSEDIGVEHSLHYYGTYEPGTLKMMDAMLRPGDHFVDVGANIGLMSVYAAQLVGDQGKVTAFEPHPKTASMLAENIALNRLHQVQFYRVALGSESGSTSIHEDLDGNRGAAYISHNSSQGMGLSIEVRTLDPYFSNEDVPRVVKVDVEGYELEVLRGMKKLLGASSPPMLIVESCTGIDRVGHIHSLFDALRKYGYHIFSTLKGKNWASQLVEVTHADLMPKHDNVYAFTSSHLQDLAAELFYKK